MKCPSCGYVSLGAAEVCKKCGASLKPERREVRSVSPGTSDDGIREEAWRTSGEGGPEPEAASGPGGTFSLDAERILNPDEIFEGIFSSDEPAEAPAGAPPEPAPKTDAPPSPPVGPLQGAAEARRPGAEPPPVPAPAESATGPEEEEIFDDFVIDLEEMAPEETPPEVSEPGQEDREAEPVALQGVQAAEGSATAGPGQIEMEMGVPETAAFHDEAWREEPVGILRRAGGLALDLGAVAAVVLVFAAAAGVALALKGVEPWWLLGAAWISQSLVPLFVLATLVSAVYFVLFLWQGGQTPGARVFSVRVLSVSGGPVTLHAAILRWLAYLVSTVPLGLGFLWAFLDRDGLAWHDRLSGTMVVDAGDESS